MMRMLWAVLAATCLVSATCRAATPAQTNDVLSKIERMAALGEDSEKGLGEAVADGIEANPSAVSAALLPRLQDKKLTEMQLAIYVWALGLAKDPAARDGIIDVYRKSKSELIQANCLRALASIGGNPSGEFLMSVLDSTPPGEMRFNILNLLGQMQYEPALPKAEEALKLDPDEYYWQSIFIFGKMGDKAVPFLIGKLNDPDLNVRGNVVNVLGKWLIAPEAAQPMFDHYWAENDAKVRAVILNSLELTVPDLPRLKRYFDEVVSKEKDEDLKKYAQETLDSLDVMREGAEEYEKERQVSASVFQEEYRLLFKSAGHEGDYQVLMLSSSLGDEPQLKALRERILQRDSDEAFYDYQKVNGVIQGNRAAHCAASEAKARPASPAGTNAASGAAKSPP